MKITTLILSCSATKFRSTIKILTTTLILATSSTAKADTLNFKNYENKEVSFNDSSTYFVLMKNNLSCMNCFFPVDHFLKELRIKYGTNYFIAVKSDSTTLNRKRSIVFAKKELPDADDYLIYNSTDAKDSTLRIKLTPSLLIIQNGKYQIIPYDSLLGGTGREIPNKLKVKIEKLLE